MRSFAIEEPGSPVPALYATLFGRNLSFLFYLIVTELTKLSYVTCMRLASSCYLDATCLFVLLHCCQIVRITDKANPIYDLYKARLQLSYQVRNVLFPESELFKRLEHFLDFHLVPLNRRIHCHPIVRGI